MTCTSGNFCSRRHELANYWPYCWGPRVKPGAVPDLKISWMTKACPWRGRDHWGEHLIRAGGWCSSAWESCFKSRSATTSFSKVFSYASALHAEVALWLWNTLRRRFRSNARRFGELLFSSFYAALECRFGNIRFSNGNTAPKASSRPRCFSQMLPSRVPSRLMSNIIWLIRRCHWLDAMLMEASRRQPPRNTRLAWIFVSQKLLGFKLKPASPSASLPTVPRKCQHLHSSWLRSRPAWIATERSSQITSRSKEVVCSLHERHRLDLKGRAKKIYKTYIHICQTYQTKLQIPHDFPHHLMAKGRDSTPLTWHIVFRWL